MTLSATIDTPRSSYAGRREIDGFPIQWKADTYALIVTSRFPTVLAQTYDLLRAVSCDSLIQCQSLYSRDGRHGLYFQFTEAPDRLVLDELTRAQASCRILSPVLSKQTGANDNYPLDR